MGEWPLGGHDQARGARLSAFAKSRGRQYRVMEMRFDEAFEILVEDCAATSLKLGDAQMAARIRAQAQGNDIWIPRIVQTHYQQKDIDARSLTDQHYLPFYDAAWELCRINVLRPGPRAPMGEGQAGGGGTYSTDGYSITESGRVWLANPERRAAGDPSRMSDIFAAFQKQYGPGFAQRANEAIRCHRNGNYLAACVMAGAAAESILLAVAIAKVGDETKVLDKYRSGGGRTKVTRLVTTGVAGSVAQAFQAPLQVLHYWRDDAAHGKATTIEEVEAYASLVVLLRLAQFCADRWAELTA